MSDYVEDAAREIKRSLRIDGIPMKDWMAASEAAIAAATPHIRAALFDELTEELEGDIKHAMKRNLMELAIAYQVVQTRCIERSQKENTQP